MPADRASAERFAGKGEVSTQSVETSGALARRGAVVLPGSRHAILDDNGSLSAPNVQQSGAFVVRGGSRPRSMAADA